MVKEYESSSNKSVNFILNVQSNECYWLKDNDNALEIGIILIAYLSNFLINNAIPTGVITNAQIISYYKKILIDACLQQNYKIY